LIIQQFDECHLLNKLPNFYIADLNLIPTNKFSDVDVVMLAKRLDRIEQRLLAFDSLDKSLDTNDQKMAMMVHCVQPSGVLSSIRNSDSVSKSHASVVNSADSGLTMEPLGVSLDDIPNINILTTLIQQSVALMSLAADASPTSPTAAVEVTSRATQESAESAKSAESDAKLGVTSS